jgi:hypothetical protein
MASLMLTRSTPPATSSDPKVWRRSCQRSGRSPAASRVRIPPPLSKRLQSASFSLALVRHGNGRLTHLSVTRPFIGVALQRESGCKQLPSLERRRADIRVLAPDGAVLPRSPFAPRSPPRPERRRVPRGSRLGVESAGRGYVSRVGIAAAARSEPRHRRRHRPTGRASAEGSGGAAVVRVAGPGDPRHVLLGPGGNRSDRLLE